MEQENNNIIFEINNTEGKRLMIISNEYNDLDNIKRLEFLLTLKNWVRDEMDKIANA